MLHIDNNYNVYQYSLGSMINLVPFPKMSLVAPPVFTQHEAPEHKLTEPDFI